MNQTCQLSLLKLSLSTVGTDDMPHNFYIILPMTSLKCIPNPFKSFQSLQVPEEEVKLQATLVYNKKYKED